MLTSEIPTLEHGPAIPAGGDKPGTPSRVSHCSKQEDSHLLEHGDLLSLLKQQLKPVKTSCVLTAFFHSSFLRVHTLLVVFFQQATWGLLGSSALDAANVFSQTGLWFSPELRCLQTGTETSCKTNRTGSLFSLLPCGPAYVRSNSISLCLSAHLLMACSLTQRPQG